MDKHSLISNLASARKFEKVDLSEFGVDEALYIRKLSVAERSVILDLWKAERTADASGFILAATLVDADGRKIFDDPEADCKEIAGEWPCDLVDSLASQILKYSGLIKEEALPEKN